MSSLTVGIAGITGKFGRLVASKLLQNPNINLRGYARDPSKVIPSIAESPRVKLFKGEAFDDTSIKPFVTGTDVIICAYLGADDLMIDGQKKLIDACDEAGVPRYVASDWALDYTKLKLGELFPKDPMIHVKAYLETKKTTKGVHILIGGFMDPILSPFFSVWDPQTQTLRYWGEGDEPFEGTSYENAAEFTAAVVADKSAIGIKKYLGDRKSIKEIAATFDKVYGVKPKLERLGSLEDLKTKMHVLREKNPTDVYSYMPLFFMYYWINGQTFVGPETDNEQYKEVKPETWEEYLSKRSLEQLPHAYFSLAN
ncbi:hypothetical protein RAB80_005542 [Fusarium oxysporum f. sp. vasinfectum]|uniref:NAD(P)-binding domain-containing protein n=1 Tax=Fusarium oxysporum f. sp. vasinfectum 25433 TaxID=1089449 RepID=X0M8V0_FUSOX|nr:hypothetical protein FOTG_14657 [Fusarium oxysporum f. sp. vasinfectum 25433]KAK2680361.1 hypothetical protein RAB80_005542 [Fusarium oxysporum f. sp. vasinfectum]KAK2935119.1 hypothetical protein FoTM2_003060 [Fusarium oxysporum f. sp. vasinfectum]